MCFRVAAEGAQFPCTSYYLFLISAVSALREIAVAGLNCECLVFLQLKGWPDAP